MYQWSFASSKKTSTPGYIEFAITTFPASGALAAYCPNLVVNTTVAGVPACAGPVSYSPSPSALITTVKGSVYLEINSWYVQVDWAYLVAGPGDQRGSGDSNDCWPHPKFDR